MSFWNRQNPHSGFLFSVFTAVAQIVTTVLIIGVSISSFFIWIAVEEKIIVWLDTDIILLPLNSYSFLSTAQIVASYFLLQTTFHNPSLTPNNSKQEKEEKDKLTTIDSIFRNRYVCCYF